MLFAMSVTAVLALSVLGQHTQGYTAEQGTVLRGLKALGGFGARNLGPVEHLRG